MHSLEIKRSSQEIQNTGKQFIPSKILTNLRQPKKRTTSYLLVLPQFRSDWGISLGNILRTYARILNQSRAKAIYNPFGNTLDQLIATELTTITSMSSLLEKIASEEVIDTAFI